MKELVQPLAQVAILLCIFSAVFCVITRKKTDIFLFVRPIVKFAIRVLTSILRSLSKTLTSWGNSTWTSAGARNRSLIAKTSLYTLWFLFRSAGIAAWLPLYVLNGHTK